MLQNHVVFRTLFLSPLHVVLGGLFSRLLIKMMAQRVPKIGLKMKLKTLSKRRFFGPPAWLGAAWLAGVPSGVTSPVLGPGWGAIRSY